MNNSELGELATPKTEVTQSPEQVGDNPWLALTPRPTKESSRVGSMTEQQPQKSSPEVTEAMQHFEEDLRRKEELGVAALDVTIDKAKLAQVKVPDRQRNRHKIGSRKIDEEIEADHLEGQRELEALMERFQRLPEKLQFQPGVTLIVGENGAGKSTLAKALFLVAKYQQMLRLDREDAALMRDGEKFVEAEDSAYKFVFEPSQSSVGDRVWLNQAGLAPDVAKAMIVDNFHSSFQSGVAIEYTDFPQVIGSQSHNEYEYARSDFDRGNSNGWEDHRSHRQTVDNLVFGELKRKKGWNSGPRIYFFDEPETGMSPRRHRQMEREIADCTTEGSVVMVPTNSVVLFESDLPRIDLDFPERGIHRPSQYPEPVTAP